MSFIVGTRREDNNTREEYGSVKLANLIRSLVFRAYVYVIAR